MKTIQKGLLVFVAILVVVSCTKKETTPPTAGETNGTLLAGAKGASKSWSLTSATVSVNGGSAQAISDIPACESDNVFVFSNNSTQDYSETEGATLCQSTDPQTIEKGSWAFTSDGKSLLIDATYYPVLAQFQAENDLPLFILSHGEPLTVAQITDSSFTITYSYQDTSTSPATKYSFTVIFTKK